MVTGSSGFSANDPIIGPSTNSLYSPSRGPPAKARALANGVPSGSLTVTGLLTLPVTVRYLSVTDSPFSAPPIL